MSSGIAQSNRNDPTAEWTKIVKISMNNKIIIEHFIASSPWNNDFLILIFLFVSLIIQEVFIIGYLFYTLCLSLVKSKWVFDWIYNMSMVSVEASFLIFFLRHNLNFTSFALESVLGIIGINFILSILHD